MRKALVVINSAGRQSNRDSVEEQLIHKLNAENYEVMIKRTPESGAGPVISKYAAGKDLIVIVGGDGTISEVVDALLKMHAQIPVAIIPAGTVNDVARIHNIPLDIKKAVEQLEDSIPEPADAIKMNDRHASYLLALGSFMTAFAEVESGVKNKIGRLAYLLAGVRMLVRLKVYDVTIKTPDTEMQSRSVFTIVSKVRSVGSVGQLIKNAEPNDGLLHIINIEPVNLFEAVHVIYLALTGHIIRHKKVKYITAESAEIEAAGLTHMNIDGDIYDYGDLHLSVMKDAVTFMKPANSKNS